MFSTRECRRDVLGALATAYFQNATHSTAWPRLVEMSGIPGLAPLFAQPVILPRHIHNYPFQRVQCVLRTLRRAGILYNPYSGGMVGSTYAHRGPPLRAFPQHACLQATLRLWYHSTPSFSYSHQLHSRRSVAGAPRSGTHPTNRNRPAMEPPSACCHGVPRKRMHLHAQLATCLRLLRPQRSSAETGHACLI